MEQFKSKIQKFRVGLSSRQYIFLFSLLAIIYLSFSYFVAPPQATLHQYHITATHARSLTISIVIPLIIIWLIGLAGSLKMKGYAQLVKTSAEGQALHTLSSGLLILVLSSPLTADLTSLVNFCGQHSPGLLSTLTIINNYIQILLTAVAFTVIAFGASRLSSLVKKPRDAVREQRIWVIGFIVLSSLYGFFLIQQPLHTPGGPRPYFMPDWLILLTIAIPYLFIWYRGLEAAYSIYRYQKNVKGLVYKNSLVYIAAGIAAVIVSSVFVRLLTTISYRLSRLTSVLLIIYAFLVVTAIGYILIAWGAKKLRRIEEV